MRASIETLPFCSARFIKVYVGIDKTREEEERRVVEIECVRRKVGRREDRLKDRCNLARLRGDNNCRRR